MTLQELLDELRKNILRDVSDQLSPGDRAVMWDDDTLVRYINEAQNRFCIKTSILRDESTAAICNITLVAGQDTYPLDPRVIAVIAASLPGPNPPQRLRIRKGTYGALFNRSGDTTFGSLYCDLQRWQETPSQHPFLFYTDRETQRMGVYPPPGTTLDGMVLNLRVSRRPVQPLLVNNKNAVPEIPEDHHMDILEWAAWKCLRNHDVDTENIPKASTHKKRFDDAVDEVSREIKRLLTDDVQFDLRNNWNLRV